MRDDHRRIQALLDAGRLTQAEADLLFAALDEGEAQRPSDVAEQVETAPQQLDKSEVSDVSIPAAADDTQPPPSALAQSVRRSLESPLKPEPDPVEVPAPPPPPEARPPQPPEPPPGPTAAPGGLPTTWAKVSGFCGDLTVRGEPGLGEPVVTGNATLERTEWGYVIRTPPEGKEGGKGWLSRLHRAAGDVSVRLPAEMGLDLALAAGDGDVHGIKRVRGNFTGGDFEVSGAEYVDLTVTAGDVNLKLCPRAGEQRLRATSGDVDVTLLAGSSVRVSGSATGGDIDLPKTFTTSGGFGTRRFEGTLGAGEARLDLRLTAGDVDIRAEGA